MASLRSLVPKEEIGRDTAEILFISLPEGSLPLREYAIIFSYDHYYSDTFFAGYKLDKRHSLELNNGRPGTAEENEKLREQAISVCKDMLDCWGEDEVPFHLYRDVEGDELELEDYEKLYSLLKEETQ